jgi:hypothetical protein
MILGAFYLLWMLRRLIFGPLHEPAGHDDHGHGVAKAPTDEQAGLDGHNRAEVRPIGWHEVAGLAPLMFLIVAVGVYPRPIFDQIQPAVNGVIRSIETQRERASEEARARQAQGSLPPRAPRGGPGSGGTTTKASGTAKKADAKARTETKSGGSPQPQSKAGENAKSTQKGSQ